MRKSIAGFEAVSTDATAAYRWSTLCFFGGMVVIAILDRVRIACRNIAATTDKTVVSAVLPGCGWGTSGPLPLVLHTAACCRLSGIKLPAVSCSLGADRPHAGAPGRQALPAQGGSPRPQPCQHLNRQFAEP